MSLRNLISENLFLPASDFVTGDSIYKCFHFLKATQFWSRNRIENYQNEKLRELVRHAYSNVPFYTGLFHDLGLTPEDIQTRNDLKKLPIITKEDLKKNKTKWLAINLDKRKLILSSSSGSTGEPFQFYSTRHSESLLRAAAIRSWYWMGYRLGDHYAKISMNPRTSVIKKIQDLVNNSLYLPATQITNSEFQKIEKKLSKSNPRFIRGYPVPIHLLSQLIEKSNKYYHGSLLKAINTTGSTLQNETRKEVEEVFRVRIFDSYSCEGGTIFAQCPAHEYYHPAEEYAISEFIEDSYTLSDPERPFRHITTDLHNYATPFIRYDTQDYVILGAQDLCSCGRHFLNIKKIKGRDSDILITPSGKYLIVENFVAYFEWITEVDQIQVIQEEINKIVIKIVVNEKFNKSVLQTIQEYWNEYIGSDVIVRIEIVDEIKLTLTGKRRTVIRNPKILING